MRVRPRNMTDTSLNDRPQTKEKQDMNANNYSSNFLKTQRKISSTVEYKRLEVTKGKQLYKKGERVNQNNDKIQAYTISEIHEIST